MKFRNFLIRVFSGLAVATVVAALFGRAQDLYNFLILSVICTGGLGLIAIIPGAYLIGLLVTIWWIPLSSTPRTPSRQPSRPPSEVLLNYARAAAANGQSASSLAAELREAGWKEHRIRQALDTAFPPTPNG
jgi:hypothetical protein